jgi:AraC-like DNA-binding protein
MPLRAYSQGSSLTTQQKEASKLQELAFLSGFSSHASFTSAFKRWTGKTPSETRALS